MDRRTAARLKAGWLPGASLRQTARCFARQVVFYPTGGVLPDRRRIPLTQRKTGGRRRRAEAFVKTDGEARCRDFGGRRPIVWQEFRYLGPSPIIAKGNPLTEKKGGQAWHRLGNQGRKARHE